MDDNDLLSNATDIQEEETPLKCTITYQLQVSSDALASLLGKVHDKKLWMEDIVYFTFMFDGDPRAVSRLELLYNKRTIEDIHYEGPFFKIDESAPTFDSKYPYQCPAVPLIRIGELESLKDSVECRMHIRDSRMLRESSIYLFVRKNSLDVPIINGSKEDL